MDHRARCEFEAGYAVPIPRDYRPPPHTVNREALVRDLHESRLLAEDHRSGPDTRAYWQRRAAHLAHTLGLAIEGLPT